MPEKDNRRSVFDATKLKIEEFDIEVARRSVVARPVGHVGVVDDTGPDFASPRDGRQPVVVDTYPMVDGPSYGASAQTEQATAIETGVVTEEERTAPPPEPEGEGYVPTEGISVGADVTGASDTEVGDAHEDETTEGADIPMAEGEEPGADNSV